MSTTLQSLLPARLGCALALGLVLALAISPRLHADEAAAPADTATPTSETSDEATEQAPAEEEATPPTDAEMAYAIDNMVLFVCAVLVLFMQAGFAMLEVGLNAAKNTVNILFKNIMDLAVGVLLFFLIGFGLMFPGDDYAGKVIGYVGHLGVSQEAPEAAAGALSPQVFFLFQVAFAATAATIVSGAVAGRMKFGAYLVYSAAITALIYPISGMWAWGGGWLAAEGFSDFAGSVVVHGVGGFAGLAGALVLGPRIGRYVKGKSIPIPGHNLAFAALGVFVLWVGWYGFNPGSQVAFTGADNTNVVVEIAVNTTLAAAAGAVVSMLLAWVLYKKPDLTMALNGALAGLVGITANCNQVVNTNAVIIGAIAGAIVIGAIILLDKLHIDDPVGAFPVHGACGVWGGIATGIFSTNSEVLISTQILGTVAICGWSFVTMLGVFAVLKAIGFLRVSAEEEMAGLDISEHGMYAYPPQLVVDFHPSSPAPRPAGALGGAPAPVPGVEGT